MVVNKKQLAPGIVVYSDVIPEYKTLPQDLEEGIIGAKLEWKQSEVTTNSNTGINKKIRDTMTIATPYNHYINENFLNIKDAFYSTLSNIFLSSFSKLENDYKFEYGFETSWHDDYTILKYEEGQQFVNHVDDHKDFHRRLSLVYYLNDDYEGGEITFPRFGITYKPNANELLLFPSTYVYNHSILPVRSGIRYSVVSWLR